MGLNLTLNCNVRLTAPEAYNSGQSQVDQNPRGDLCAAPSLLPKTELSRLANCWYMVIPTGSAFNLVAGYPATTGTRAELVAYNGYTDTTCMVIDQIWFQNIVTQGAISGYTLLYQVAAGVAAPTNDTTVLISSPLGKGYSGSVTRQMAVTTMTTNKWAVAGAGSSNGASVSVGASVVAEMGGNVIVKPGFTIGFNVIAGTTNTAGGLIGFSWHEVKLPLI
jgi:hypothetical protein